MIRILQKVDSTLASVKELRSDVLRINKMVDSHSTSIKQLEQQMGQLSAIVNHKKNGALPSDIFQNSQTKM